MTLTFHVLTLDSGHRVSHVINFYTKFEILRNIHFISHCSYAITSACEDHTVYRFRLQCNCSKRCKLRTTTISSVGKDHLVYRFRLTEVNSPPWTGVFIGNRTLKSFRPNEVRRKIAVVSQISGCIAVFITPHAALKGRHIQCSVVCKLVCIAHHTTAVIF